ncbi:hypothetical protein VPHK435_0084 [Vibrio phage K435]
MIIKQASDLHFTYVENTPELREAFVAKCSEFGIGVFGLGGEKYLEVYSDGYDEFEICGTDSLEPQSKKLTMSDLTDIPTETPEEKEVLDSIESAGGVEWKNGDECVYEHQPDVTYMFIGMHPVNKKSAICWNEKEGIAQIHIDFILKPESPQQREERERLEAAEDLYITYMSKWEFAQDWCALDDINKSAFLAIVDKTNYRKEKTNGTN